MLSTVPEARAIAVGVVQRPDGAVLLGQRRADQSYPGYWEFPGGKVEPGESLRQALVRELREELGIVVEQEAALLTLVHPYPEGAVQLHVRRVLQFQGHVAGREGQALAWVQPAALGEWRLLPADGPIVRALQLPPHYVFSPPTTALSQWQGRLAQLPPGSLLRLRRPGLAAAAYRQEAEMLQAECRALGLRLMLDREPSLVQALGAAGWHASAAAAMDISPVRAQQDGQCLAVSCHNAQEAHQARALGAGCIVVGAVQATRSHPHATGLGWSALQVLADDAGLPVYAIGGVGPAQLALAQQHGCVGVAGISAYWGGGCDSSGGTSSSAGIA